MRMHAPTHPGIILLEMYLQPLELTVTETAAALGVTRQSLSELLNARRSVSVEMALRLSIAFSTTPEFWLNLQTQFDLWKLRGKKFKKVHPLNHKAA